MPQFRQPAPIGQKFDMVSRTFLEYENGSKMFNEPFDTSPYQRWILNNPTFSGKKVITQVYIP